MFNTSLTKPLGLVGAVVLFSLYTASAGAQLATDLDCAKCVDITDMARDSVGTNKIVNRAVIRMKLAKGAVATGKISDNAVTKEKLASDAVSTNKIVDAAVTEPKLADGAVTAAKLADGAVTAAALAPGAVPVATQSDHALYFPGTDDAIYCGVDLDEFVEPWTLHVTASVEGATKGSITLTFNDGDPILFVVPAEGSFSMTHAMGGVPGLTDGVVNSGEGDDLVKITANAEVDSIMASASARDGAVDPFDETFGAGAGSGAAEPDNFCITAPDDPGADWAVANFPEG